MVTFWHAGFVKLMLKLKMLFSYVSIILSVVSPSVPSVLFPEYFKSAADLVIVTGGKMMFEW